jgi:hypothetical protein
MFLKNILSVFVEYLGFAKEYLWITHKERLVRFPHLLFEPHLVGHPTHYMTFTISALGN